jgi:hypothetical protein
MVSMARNVPIHRVGVRVQFVFDVLGSTAFRAATAIAFAAAVGSGISGCKPHVGSSCTAGQAACLDKTSGLFCGADNKYAAMSCNGGCSISGRDVTCDNAQAALGDGCAEVGDVACETDKKNALQCGNDHKFAIGETCKGPRGCVVNGNAIDCDNDTSDIGDPCHTIGDYACTSDKALLLRCNDHKMDPLNSCRGPKACRIFELPQEKKIDFVCDDSVAQENDPCDTNGEEACTMDKKAMYVCKSNKFVSYKACPGGTGCTYEEHGDKYACDEGHAQAAGGAATATGPAAGAKGAANPKKKGK